MHFPINLHIQDDSEGIWQFTRALWSDLNYYPDFELKNNILIVLGV